MRDRETERQRQKEGKEENVLFNDTLNTFYVRLYGVGDRNKDILIRNMDKL